MKLTDAPALIRMPGDDLPPDVTTVAQAIELASYRARTKALEDEVCKKIGHRLDDYDGEPRRDILDRLMCARCDRVFPFTVIDERA